MIKCDNISKTYREGNVLALNKLCLEVEAHSVYGFLGPNGAGKTTAIKILTGLMQPSSGDAWVAGQRVGERTRKLRAQIGYLGQEPALYDWMTGMELLVFVGALFGLSKQENKERAGFLLEMSGLKDAANKKAASYSGGMKQRLGIAQALVNKPRVLFLDEPTAALDPIGRKEVLEFISNIRHETTVFMSTHILSDVERVCTHVGILNKGELLASEGIQQLKGRFAPDTCKLEFENEDEAVLFRQCLQQNSNMQSATEGSSVKVRLNSVKEDYASLLSILATHSAVAKKIELDVSSLEDIFVKFVNN